MKFTNQERKFFLVEFWRRMGHPPDFLEINGCTERDKVSQINRNLLKNYDQKQQRQNKHLMTDNYHPSPTLVPNTQQSDIIPIIHDNLIKTQNLEKPISVFSMESSQILSKKYKFYIGAGNNSNLVRKILLARLDWCEIYQNNEKAHFVWSPFSRGIKFPKLSPSHQHPNMVNHFEFHRELSIKSNLLQNLTSFCQKNKLQVFQVTPPTFQINLNDNNWELQVKNFLDFYLKNQPKKRENGKRMLEIRRKYRAVCGARQRGEQQGQGLGGSMVKKGDEDYYVWILKPINLNRGRYFIDTNHMFFRGIEIFSTLEQLEKYLNDYYVGFEEKSFKKINQNISQKSKKHHKSKDNNRTFKNNSQIKDSQIIDLKTQYITEKEDQNESEKDNSISIHEDDNLSQKSTDDQLQNNNINNNENNNKGDTDENNNNNNENEVENIMDVAGQAKVNNKPYILKESSFIIQKYIECPLLVKSKKFDIRVWVLVTQSLDVYIFKEGYLRLSSENYNLSQLDNPFIHLTNNAVQKFADNYESDSGNIMTYDEFQTYLYQRKIKLDFREQLIPKIYDQVHISLKSVQTKINRNGRKYCFEIFGYDFIIDELFQPWLIEVNTNPSIEESSPILSKYIQRMLDDAAKLTIDKLFPPTKRSKPSSKIQRKRYQVQYDKESSERNIFQGQNSQSFENRPSIFKEKRTSSCQMTEGQFPQLSKGEQPTYPVPNYIDMENMWELICNLNKHYIQQDQQPLILAQQEQDLEEIQQKSSLFSKKSSQNLFKD